MVTLRLFYCQKNHISINCSYSILNYFNIFILLHSTVCCSLLMINFYFSGNMTGCPRSWVLLPTKKRILYTFNRRMLRVSLILYLEVGRHIDAQATNIINFSRCSRSLQPQSVLFLVNLRKLRPLKTKVSGSKDSIFEYLIPALLPC